MPIPSTQFSYKFHLQSRRHIFLLLNILLQSVSQRQLCTLSHWETFVNQIAISSCQSTQTRPPSSCTDPSIRDIWESSQSSYQLSSHLHDSAKLWTIAAPPPLPSSHTRPPPPPTLFNLDTLTTGPRRYCEEECYHSSLVSEQLLPCSMSVPSSKPCAAKNNTAKDTVPLLCLPKRQSCCSFYKSSPFSPFQHFLLHPLW